MGCGQHRAGDGSRLLIDRVDRIPCKRACELCRSAVDPGNRCEFEGEREARVQRAIDWARSHYPWASFTGGP